MWDKIKSVRALGKQSRRDRDRIDLNQSYTDPQKDYLGLNKSFNMDLNHSMGDIDSSRFDSFSIDTISAKVNITSVLNNPKKLSWVNEVLNAIQEQFTDDTNINNFCEIKPIRTIKEDTHVDLADFTTYVNNIAKVLEIYKKNNNAKLQRERDKEQINLTENLVNCYRRVPSYYFDPKFVFNFENLNRDIAKMLLIQDELNEGLDLVELNLFYQITTRFKEFLDIIMKLNEMERQINNCLHDIQFFKESNKILKEKLNGPSMKILKLKRRQVNIEKVIHLLDLMRLVQDTIPTMEKLIRNSNFETAVNLIKESEETYANTLKPIICMKNYQINFQNGRETLESIFQKEFYKSCIGYITQALVYRKASASNYSDNISPIKGDDNLLTMVSGMTSTTGISDNTDANSSMDIEDRVTIKIPWAIVMVKRDDKIEDYLSRLIIENIKIKEIKLGSYRANLIDILKRFNAQFLKDMQEYIDDLNLMPIGSAPMQQQQQQQQIGSTGSTSVISPIPVPMTPTTTGIPTLSNGGTGTTTVVGQSKPQQPSAIFQDNLLTNIQIKFLIFHVELYKNLISRHLSLNMKILTGILEYYDKNYVDIHGLNGATIPLNDQGEPLRRLDHNTIKAVIYNVEEFYLVITNIMKMFIKNVSDMINKIKFDNSGVPNKHEFYKLIAVFEDIRIHFDDKLQMNNMLYGWYSKINKPKIITELNKLTNNLIDKISMTSLYNLRIQSEKNFIESYHKQKMAVLVNSLTQEPWVHVDISDKYLDYFKLLFNEARAGLADTNNKLDSESISMAIEEILKSSRPTIANASSDATYEEIEATEDELDLATDRSISMITDRSTVGNEEEEEKKVNINAKELLEKNIYIMKNEIYIHNNRYRLTSSFLILIKIIHDYLTLIKRLRSSTKATTISPGISSSSSTIASSPSSSILFILTKLFEIIKYYSSFTCQLILGAGAIPLGIIKTITAKILAFSALDLSLLLVIVQNIQNVILPSIDCNKDNIINELKVIKNDISNHKNELFGKICIILKERLIAQCNNIEKIGWHNPAENINIPTKSSAQILVNTRTMYNQIEDFCNTDDLTNAFQRILDDIASNYLVIFEKMNVDNKKTAQRVREELEYFTNDLKKIKIMNQLQFDIFEKRVQTLLNDKCNYYLETTYL